jgi:site-specific recombinase XerD
LESERWQTQEEEFAQTQGIRYVKELDTPALRTFPASWKDNNLAAVKKFERLRSFFRFARENGRLTENPAEKLESLLGGVALGV